MMDQAEQASVANIECHLGSSSGVERVTQDRTGHASAATSTPAELTRGDGDHLDSRLAQCSVGENVAVVADYDARFERHDVVAVVPLLTLDAVDIAGGRHHPEVHADGFADGGNQPLRLAPDVQA